MSEENIKKFVKIVMTCFLCFITVFILAGIILSIPVFIAMHKIRNSIPSDNTKPIDYSLYLNKIWVADDWDYESYRYAPSFYITKMEDGQVEGKFTTGLYIRPPCFMYSFNHVTYNSYLDISGFYNEICKINNGTIEFAFLEKDRIEATITYDERDFDNREFPSGTYSFRPYNLDRISEFMINTSSFAVDLNYWGEVNFVTTVIDGNKPYPIAYLTNEYNDVLYEFGAFTNGFEITDVLIEDINGDGLNDVVIIVEADIYKSTWTFIQMENGLFYSSHLDETSIITIGERAFTIEEINAGIKETFISNMYYWNWDYRDDEDEDRNFILYNLLINRPLFLNRDVEYEVYFQPNVTRFTGVPKPIIQVLITNLQGFFECAKTSQIQCLSVFRFTRIY